MINFIRGRNGVFLAGMNLKRGVELMVRQYECILVADGYRIRVTIFTADQSSVEALARQRASERLKQIYGITKAPVEFVITEVMERIFH